MPWGQELQVFAQNTGRTRIFRGRRAGRALLAARVRLPPRRRPGRAAGAESTGWLADDRTAAPPLAGTAEADDAAAARGRTGYLLLLPAALWLGLFFVIPFYSLVATSLYDPSGSDFRGYEMTYALRRTTWTPSRSTGSRCCASLGYAAIATADLPGARLRAGLRDRLQGRALEEPDAGAGDRAVLHQLPGPDAVVEADPGRRRAIVVDLLQFLHLLGDDGRLLATPFAVVTGLTYNFLPFMVLPLFASIDKIDPRLIEASSDLYANPVVGVLQGHLAAVAAGRGLRHPADLHPGGRRLHQRPAARQHRHRG